MNNDIIKYIFNNIIKSMENYNKSKDQTKLEKIVSDIYELAVEVEKILPTPTGKHRAFLARTAVSAAMDSADMDATMKKLDIIYEDLAIFYDNEDDKLCVKQQIDADRECEREELQAIKEFIAKNGIINFH